MFDKDLGELKRIWISADLGLEHDYTFISVLDNFEKREEKYSYEAGRWMSTYKTLYRAQDMRRLSLPTSEDDIKRAVVRYVMDAHKRADGLGRTDHRGPDVWVTLDRTGIGMSITRNVLAAVVQAETLAGISPLRRSYVRAVHITSGMRMNRKGWVYTIPRDELLYTTKGAVGSGRFRASRKLVLAKVFEEELRAFNPDKKLRKDDETEEALWRRPGRHDDSIFSVGMAVTIAETLKPADHWKTLRNPSDDEHYEEPPPVASAARTPITGTPLPPLP